MRIWRSLGGERGQATVLIVCVLPIFILLMGWSIDVGRVLAAKTELAKATDIAAQEVAKGIDMNVACSTGEQLNQDVGADAGWWVRENLNGLCGGVLESVGTQRGERYVRVESEARVPLLFCGLIGKRETAIKAHAFGRLRVVKRAP